MAVIANYDGFLVSKSEKKEKKSENREGKNKKRDGGFFFSFF